MRILMVMAHPDDEVIFGWPIIQDKQDNDISVLTLASNQERHPHALTALKEVCELNEVRYLQCGAAKNNFYRLAPRFETVLLRDTITLFNKSINDAINLARPDYIFTHNPWGEYGHGDHRFVFNFASMYDVPLMLTDICFANACHLSGDNVPGIYSRYLFGKGGTRHVLDAVWYARMKEIYERHNAWSWSGHEPVTECNLYSFD